MKRRTVLRTIAGTVAGAVSVPAWATGWPLTLAPPQPPLLADEQDALLAELAETFIPATETPGAKGLNVHRFIQRMVADCYDVSAQEQFRSGLADIDQLARQRLGTSFAASSPGARLTFLRQVMQEEKSPQKDVCQLVKKLTIQGYMTSEYVMTNLTKYEFAPGYYNGCVPLAKQPTLSTH